jgi:hypothetical protein
MMNQKTTSNQMTATFQTNILETGYNGWANYETWNVALWIQNDYHFYCIAQDCKDYAQLINDLGEDTQTLDGVAFNDPKVNHFEINEMMASL